MPSHDPSATKLNKWQQAQLEYKNRSVYQTSLLKNNNYWTKNQQIISGYKKCYQINPNELLVGSQEGAVTAHQDNDTSNRPSSINTTQNFRKTINPKSDWNQSRDKEGKGYIAIV